MSSHFPAFDRLEEVLRHWPSLIEGLAGATQPLGVQHGELIMLCSDQGAVRLIQQRHDELVGRLRELSTGDLRRELRRIRPVVATTTEIFLARQLVVAQAKLRDIELGF